MDKARPIEKGCLAIILRTEMAGMVVTVGDYLGPTPIKKGGTVQRAWEIDYDNMCAAEHILMRIDDPNIQKQIENEREKVCG